MDSRGRLGIGQDGKGYLGTAGDWGDSRALEKRAGDYEGKAGHG